MLRIMWQGKTRALAAQAQVELMVGAWQEAWFGASLSAQINACSQDAGCEAADTGWHARDPAGGHVWLKAGQGVARGLAARALQLQKAGDLELLDQVGHRCVEALVRSVHGSKGVHVVPGTAADGVAPFLEHHGGLCFRLDGLAGSAMLGVDAAWCATHAGPSGARRALALDARRAALSSSRVRVKASLSLGTIDLLESLQFKVGEVLITDVSSTPMVELSTASGRVAVGRLTSTAGARAVAVD